LFGAIQLLEGWLITPKIEGDSTDFTPSTTLVLIAIGAALGGAFGMLIALPIAAVFRTVLQYVSRRLSGMPSAVALDGLVPSSPELAPAEERLPEPKPTPAVTTVESIG
jgi:hypothetical protein